MSYQNGLEMFCELYSTYLRLRKWQENPSATKRKIGYLSTWQNAQAENDLPLSTDEVLWLKQILNRHTPFSYRDFFGPAT
jgi:hypothetical protein